MFQRLRDALNAHEKVSYRIPFPSKYVVYLFNQLPLFHSTAFDTHYALWLFWHGVSRSIQLYSSCLIPTHNVFHLMCIQFLCLLFILTFFSFILIFLMYSLCVFFCTSFSFFFMNWFSNDDDVMLKLSETVVLAEIAA